MDEEKEVLEGFNAGYLIEKHRPELAQQLTENLEGVELPFIEGFIAGSKESIREREQIRLKVISKLKDFTKGDIPESIKKKDRDGKDRGFEMDI